MTPEHPDGETSRYAEAWAARKPDPLRHLDRATYELVVCPFCGERLSPYGLHRCDGMESDGARAIPPRLDRIIRAIGWVVIFVAAVYLTAHLLVAAGVGL